MSEEKGELLNCKKMKKNLFEECFACEDRCCKKKIAYPLFLTSEEKTRFPKINSKFPCKSYKEKCNVYHNRPIDCRLFPFDIHKMDEKFYWIIWVDEKCKISGGGIKKVT